MADPTFPRRVAGALLALVPVAALLAVGPFLLGHALFALGFTGAGAGLMHDSGWRGFALAKSGDYLAAAEAFGPAPANSYDRGNALALAGRYHAALDAYDDALQADPEDEDARHNKAVVAKILDGEPAAAGRSNGKANARAAKQIVGGSNEGDNSSSGSGFIGENEGATNASDGGGGSVSKTGSGQDAPTGDNSGKATGAAGLSAGRGRSGDDMADAITRQLAINQHRLAKAFTQGDVKPTVHWLETVTDDPGSWLKLQIQAERKRRTEQADRETEQGKQ